jgi:predicted dehydrogenase
MPAVAAHPGVRLVGLADEPGLPERWQRTNVDLAARFGVPYSEDIDAMLARPDVDAVCVAAEYVRHGHLAVRVLEAGKHLFLDKPMATTLAECRAIGQAAAAAAGTGVKALTFSRYTSPAVQQALAAVRAGRIGRVRALSSQYIASYGPGERYDPVTDFNWEPRYTGGGELLNFLLYPMTNIRLLAGAGVEVETVQCLGGALFNRAHRELGIEDMATIVLGMTGGVVATVLVGRCHTPLHPTLGDVRLTVIGTTGAVEADESRPALSLYGRATVGVVDRLLDDDNIITQELIDRFVRWVREDIDPGQSVLDSLRVMEVVFAAEEALRTGSVVRLAS